MAVRAFKGISSKRYIGIREALTGVKPREVREVVEAAKFTTGKVLVKQINSASPYGFAEERVMDGSSFYQDGQARVSKTVKGL